MCRGLEGGCEAVQGAVIGQGEGKRGGRGVVGDVRRGGLGLRWSAASAAAETVEAQAAAVVGRQRLGEALGRGGHLHGWEALVKQLSRGLRPGWPLHLRLRGGLQLGLWGTWWRLSARRTWLGGSLHALRQVRIWRRSSKLGLHGLLG